MFNAEIIRALQKNGEYKFEGMTREESRRAAVQLSKQAMAEDERNGIRSAFGIRRDAFGYYSAVSLG